MHVTYNIQNDTQTIRQIIFVCKNIKILRLLLIKYEVFVTTVTLPLDKNVELTTSRLL